MPPSKKNHIYGLMFTISGSCTQPPLTMMSKFGMLDRVDPKSMLTCQISSRLVYSVTLGQQKTQILLFFGHRHIVVSPLGKWQRTVWRKLNVGAQWQTFPIYYYYYYYYYNYYYTTPWVKKGRHYTLVHIFAKYWPIFIILSTKHSVGNLQ